MRQLLVGVVCLLVVGGTKVEISNPRIVDELVCGEKDSCLNSPRVRTRESHPVLERALSLFREKINPALARLVYSDRLPGPHALADMKALLDVLETVTSEQNITLLASSELGEFWKLGNFAIQKGINIPQTIDMYKETTSGWIHFILDVVSITGHGLLQVEDLPLIADQLSRFPPRHRRFSEKDIVPPPPPFMHADAQGLTAMARSIDTVLSVRDVPDDGFQNFMNMVDRIQFYADGSSAESIMFFQLRNLVCPNLRRVFEGARVSANRLAAFRKRGLALIDFCKSYVSGIRMIPLSILLEKNLSSRPLYGGADAEKLVVDLFNPETEWTGGLDPSLIPDRGGFMNRVLEVFVQTHQPVFKDMKGDMLKTAIDFDSREEFENRSIAFGRLLGLCFRYSATIGKFIKFPGPIVRAIRALDVSDFVKPQVVPGQRKRLPSDEYFDSVQRRIFEPIFFLRLGIQDVLGPAGVGLFSESEWREQFRW